eukprot:909076_1
MSTAQILNRLLDVSNKAFGKELAIALDRINNIESSKSSVKQYMQKMSNNRVIISKNAMRHQRKYDTRRSKNYNKNRKDAIEYEVGDFVMIDVTRRYVGNRKKLSASWNGPFEIIRIMDKQYEVREVGNESNVQLINPRFMKPYKSSPYFNAMTCCLMRMNDDEKRCKRILKYINQKYRTMSSK